MKVRTHIQLALATTLCLLLNTAYSFESDISYLGHLSDGGTGNLGETIEGLNGAIDVVVSSSGKVYVAGFVDDAVAVFNLNRSTNQLEQVQVLKNGVNNVSGLNGISALTLSPDESQLYATSLYDKSFVIFNVDSSGLLSQAQVFTEGDVDSFGRTIDGMSRLFDSGNTDIMVSDDGLFVYVANQYAGGAIFKKDTSDNNFYSIEPNQHSGMIGTRAGLLTSNHQDLYTVNTTVDAVYHYSRDAQSGLLTFVQRFDDGSTYPELTNPRHLSSNTDESILVVSGITDDSLVVFDRTTESGVISYSYALKNGSTDSLGNTISSIVGPMSTAFNHIGTKLVSANYDADSLGLFSSQSGTPISFSGSIDSNETIGGSQLSSFDGPRAIHFTQDDQYFVVASYASDSIHLFYDQDVDKDGIVNDQDPTPNGEGTGNNGDQDGDGVADEEDVFPTDPTEWSDQDGDGVGDNSDAFPTNPEEWSDQDGDNVGDNSDQFPTDPTEWSDQDGDGIGDNSDQDPAPIELVINSSRSNILVTPGQSVDIEFAISYYATLDPNRTVIISQQLEVLSGSVNDVSINPLVSESKQLYSSETWSYTQSFSSSSNGTFILKTTAQFTDTGESVELSQRIIVSDFSEDFDLSQVGTLPSLLPPSAVTPVTVSIRIRSENIYAGLSLNVEGDLAVELNDDGANGDIVAGDGFYSGTVDVDTSGLNPGDCLHLVARGIRGSYEKTSEERRLCVSSYASLQISDQPGHQLLDPSTGYSYVSDEIIIVLQDNKSESEIAQIAQSVGATIIDWIPELNYAFLRYPQEFTDVAELFQEVNSLESNPNIISAAPNSLSLDFESNSFEPKDIYYDEQWYLKKVQANAAWSLGYVGTKLVAVIDSGVDYTHPDLRGKVYTDGPNFVQFGDKPMDVYGHGTKVAGIIGAKSNNGDGITSVTWDSKILPIKVYQSRADGFDARKIIKGMEYAANSQADIINMSLGSYNPRTESIYCPAAEKITAANKILVAAVGNESEEIKAFPAACANERVLSVASTNQADAKWSHSNYGDWVKVSAPGVNMRTTGLASELYPVVNGTSFASPMVAGALAIVFNKFPQYTPEEAIDRILKNVDYIDPALKIGAGRLNIYRAVADHGILTASALGSGYTFVGFGSKDWMSTTLGF